MEPVSHEVTDEELVSRVQKAPEGDLRAFEVLVERHQQRILANCRYITRSDEAEDLAQEVFVKAFFGLKRFEGRSQFKTWLQRIKVNHCLNFNRKHKDRTFVDADDAAMEAHEALHVAPKAHRAAEASDQREAIRAVLDAMPETLRVPLILRDLDGYSYQEIADSLDIGLSATKMRIKRAREEFRERFAGLRDPAPQEAPNPGPSPEGESA